MGIPKQTEDQNEAFRLRKYLREKTFEDHKNTEDAFEGHDLTKLTGLTRFLLAHYQANAAIEKAQSELPWPADLPRPPSALPSLMASLTELKHVPSGELPHVDLPEPIGAAYVIAGSRFGNRVLKRRWLGSTDNLALNAGAYFNDQALDRHSKEFMAALTAHHPLDINDITSSAQMAFQTFANAGSLHLQQKV